jgi:hypothetical protein
MTTFEPTRTLGYRQHDRTLGSWMFPRVGWRIYSTVTQTIRVRAWNIDQDVTIQKNGIVTIRPTTEHLRPTDYGWNGEEYRGGSPTGIDPYGVGTLHDHDRTMQRHSVGNYQVATGTLPRAYTRPNYNLLRAEYANPKPFAGTHLVRAYRHAIGFLDDPIVKLDLRMIAYDAGLAWSAKFETAIASMPGGKGHGACGREWAWVAYVAALAQDRTLARRMARIARHVAQPWGGLLRQAQPWFSGSPSPWGPQPAGSDVPTGVPVAQDLECYHTVLALDAIGERELANRLANTVLAKPLKKWIDADKAVGVGSRHVDLPQGWIGLSALTRWDVRRAVDYAMKWPIQTAGGSQVGPFKSIASIRKALQEWGQVGKCGPFLEATK